MSQDRISSKSLKNEIETLSESIAMEKVVHDELSDDMISVLEWRIKSIHKELDKRNKTTRKKKESKESKAIRSKNKHYGPNNVMEVPRYRESVY